MTIKNAASGKVKDKHQDRKKYLQTIYLIRDMCLEYIRALTTQQQKDNQVIKCAKDSKYTFLKEGMQVANKHMKRCSDHCP